MQIDITTGEAVDRLSIMKLKREFTSHDPTKEIKDLERSLGEIVNCAQSRQILALNTALWNLEDAVRANPEHFEIVASAIFVLNEIRSELKRSLDEKFDGTTTEGKVYGNSGKNM